MRTLREYYINKYGEEPPNTDDVKLLLALSNEWRECFMEAYASQFKAIASPSPTTEVKDAEAAFEKILRDNITIAMEGEGRVIFDYTVAAQLCAEFSQRQGQKTNQTKL